MNILSISPNPAEYKALTGCAASLCGLTVEVGTYDKESRTGSWSRGFKFTHSVYGYLKRNVTTKGGYRPYRFSADHAITWHDSLGEAKKQRAGKILVERRKSAEFAFEGIQAINRDYDRNYKWTP